MPRVVGTRLPSACSSHGYWARLQVEYTVTTELDQSHRRQRLGLPLRRGRSGVEARDGVHLRIAGEVSGGDEAGPAPSDVDADLFETLGDVFGADELIARRQRPWRPEPGATEHDPREDLQDFAGGERVAEAVDGEVSKPAHRDRLVGAFPGREVLVAREDDFARVWGDATAG